MANPETRFAAPDEPGTVFQTDLIAQLPRTAGTNCFLVTARHALGILRLQTEGTAAARLRCECQVR